MAGGATGRSPVTSVRGWALCSAPAGVAGWVSLVTALAAAVAVVAAIDLPGHRPGAGAVLTVLVLVGCGAVCVEAARRVGEVAGASNDLLSAWTLPIALLLPPVWSLLVPVPLTVLLQLRVARSPLHRRVFSVAAIGLSNAAVSVLFHEAVRRGVGGAGGGAHAYGLALAGLGVADRTGLVAAAVGCAAVGCALNVFLVGTVVRLGAPQVTWRELVVDRPQRSLDVAEIALGVTVAVCWWVTPLLAVAMLVPVLLVQRSLTHHQLLAAARTDAKTGLLNATAWQEEAEREIVRARREGRPVAVVITDIDHFKRVNDTHGHLAGDVALRATVAALAGALRPYDVLGRFGGEEFTVVLPGAGPVEARDIAERLRRAVATVPVVLDDCVVELSVSVGVAVLGPNGRDLTDLLAAADEALYRAKRAGRNQVALAR